MKKFTKVKEDFTCSVCKTKVKGTGYTDHCPKCLYSLHVDIFPGDRKSECHGLMKPVGAFQEKGVWKIEYLCQKCKYSRQNKAASEDNFGKVVELTSKRSH